VQQRATDSTSSRAPWLGIRAAASTLVVLLAGVAAPRAEAAAPPGQWWNAAYAERLNITVTAGATPAPTDYSMFVTIDHARMVSTGRSLASGDDVRVVYWNGGSWVELDRLLDDQSSWNNWRTGIWFRTQAAIGAFATDDNYYIYYGNATPGAPLTDWANVFLFYDNFNSGGLDTTTRWTPCTGTCTQSGGTLSLGASSRVWAQATYSFGYDTRWEAEQQLVSPFANLNHLGAADQDSFCCLASNDWIVFWHDGTDPEWETGDNAGFVGNTYTNGSPGSFHVYAFDRVGSGSVRFSLDNQPFHNETGTLPDASLRPRLENEGGGGQVVTDWVRVRRYVVPEPDANARRESTIIGGSCMVVTDIGGSAYDSSQPYWGDDEARSVALQSDGKIVVGGFGYVNWATDFAVARYNADFRLDTAFGAAGIATTNVDFDDQGWAVAIQPDGKIVLGGHDRVGTSWTNDDFAVARYDTNGILDTSFNPLGGFGDPPNRAGTVTTRVGTSWDLGRPMVLQDDGKIVLAGPVDDGSTSNYDFGVVRYLDTGQLDTTFGGTGIVVTPVGARNDYANALAVKADPGGYVLVAGASTDTAGWSDYDFSMVRYDLLGGLDPSFGSGGTVKTDLRGGQDWGAAVAVQPDGKIVMAGGSVGPGGDTDFAVVRYEADGSSLDGSFGPGGMVFTPMAPGDVDDAANGVVLQPDGKILVVGSATNASGDDDFAVVRYNADGSLDTSFGFGGKVTTPIGGGDDQANAVVLQADGRIVVVGRSDNTLAQDPDFAMVRYNANGSLDNTCGQVFYSIGTNPGNLATGSPSIDITSGTATLAPAQTNDVGLGDMIDYGGGQVFISGVISPTQFRVQTKTGDLPLDFTGSVSSITRAFNSISSAVTGSVNGSHLGNGNLIALEKGLTWVCYKDGPLVETAQLTGYTTSATHFVTLTVADASQVASGVSQRHIGVAGTGAVVQPPLNGGILVRDDFTVVEWLEIDGSSTSGANGLDVNTTGTGGLFRNLLIHDFTGGSAKCYYANTTGNTLRNSMLHGCESGVVLNQDNNALYNVTVHGAVRGVSASNGSTGGVAENVIATGGTTADFIEQTGGTFSVFNNNLSEDASAASFGGSGNLDSRAATSQFVSLGSPVNLHLRAGADAIDAGKSLSTFFANDVDNHPRPQGAAWDVGADESFLSAATTYYRSIGTAPDLVDAGPITVTAGSAVVTKSGGPGWKAQNRGRGDVLIVGANTYMVGSVVSDDMLTLASLPSAGYSGAYTIARQFSTLQAWENCIDGQGGSPPPAAPCYYFPAPTSSLVADDRQEIGIAYDDATPSFPLGGDVSIEGSTTDASHTILLTADPGNRHNGVAGDGVVVDAQLSGNELDIRDSNVTVEWLEFVGARGDSISPIQVYGTSAGGPTNVALQHLLIHDFGDKVAGSNDSSGIDLAGDTSGAPEGMSVTVRNSMIWDGDQYGIEGDGTLDSMVIENVSIDGMTERGIYATTSTFIVRNCIVTHPLPVPGGYLADFAVSSGSLSGSNNTSADGTAFSAFSNDPQANTGVDPASIFVAENSDLHLLAGAITEIDTGLDLSVSFSSDIDGQIRPAGAAWTGVRMNSGPRRQWSSCRSRPCLPIPRWS
jgi:uncharacterized delta-60 repeat protein